MSDLIRYVWFENILETHRITVGLLLFPYCVHYLLGFLVSNGIILIFIFAEMQCSSMRLFNIILES